MFGEHHDLTHELPEYRDAIHRLKTSNAHFARLFEAYGKLDRDVRKMEADVEPVSDAVLETAKKERLALKDELFGMLKADEASAA
jgi:uncharacterized protein YdcH (DUF465 family)